MAPRPKPPPWLKPKSRSGSVAVSIGWYTEEQWQKVKAAATDAERFEASYREWIDMAESALRDLRATGIAAEKFHVDAEALLAWCLAHGRKNDASARAEFVSQQARRQSESGKRPADLS